MFNNVICYEEAKGSHYNVQISGTSDMSYFLHVLILSCTMSVLQKHCVKLYISTKTQVPIIQIKFLCLTYQHKDCLKRAINLLSTNYNIYASS